MNCVARRWAGTATVKERPTNTVLANEMNDRLKMMQNERGQQDSFFSGQTQQTKQTQQTQVVIRETTGVQIPVYDLSKTRGF
jgi:outer membrane biogenesis lipoprotein LolB